MSGIIYEDQTFYTTREEYIPDQYIIDVKVDEKYCIEVYPCQHDTIVILKDGSEIHSSYINGRQIYGMYKMLGKEIPEHFQGYKNMYEQNKTIGLCKIIRTPVQF